MPTTPFWHLMETNWSFQEMWSVKQRFLCRALGIKRIVQVFIKLEALLAKIPVNGVVKVVSDTVGLM
jgi:hypothetical protein